MRTTAEMERLLADLDLWKDEVHRRDEIINSETSLRKEFQAELVEVREILAHTDIGSLPNDWTAKMIAEARIDDLIKLRDQVRDTCVRAEKAEAEVVRLSMPQS